MNVLHSWYLPMNKTIISCFCAITFLSMWIEVIVVINSNPSNLLWIAFGCNLMSFIIACSRIQVRITESINFKLSLILINAFFIVSLAETLLLYFSVDKELFTFIITVLAFKLSFTVVSNLAMCKWKKMNYTQVI